MIDKITFKPSQEQIEKLKYLGRYVNLSQLMRDSLDIVLSRVNLNMIEGEKGNE